MAEQVNEINSAAFNQVHLHANSSCLRAGSIGKHVNKGKSGTYIASMS